MPRPAGLTRFSPPPDDRTDTVGSNRADDPELEEGDESGATDEEVGEVEETGPGSRDCCLVGGVSFERGRRGVENHELDEARARGGRIVR